ncbi:MAG: DUF2914 domain-containing protein [Alphaproteobacteria bacterium]|nr:DUF2914 domain-containing protein [Alphaproteobacteria bacterium]MBV9692276.1 DUF2914 domain-containing protein [Alphaproteobacteria bacterium]
MQLSSHAHKLRRVWLAWIPRYERQLSAAGMLLGFATDNFMFRRVDLPNTQIVFVVYLALAAVSILILHLINAHSDPETERPRWQSFLPFATQFALGGLWSGFLIFYTRSAVLLASWPFLLVLAAIFIGNEVFKRYHSRLAFTATLLFFAMFSYAMVTVPLFTHTIGAATFLLSGALAIAVFALFLYVLYLFGRTSLVASKWQIIAGAAGVYTMINLFWFIDVLPPLPVALAKAGVFNAIRHSGDDYLGTAEPQPWYANALISPPIVHVQRGAPLYAYTAVFAPVRLSTRVVHAWQHYDRRAKRWVTVSTVAYAINGGRDGGYRGYTIHHDPEDGDWRVNISTDDGHPLGRIRFRVAEGAPENLATTNLD